MYTELYFCTLYHINTIQNSISVQIASRSSKYRTVFSVLYTVNCSDKFISYRTFFSVQYVVNNHFSLTKMDHKKPVSSLQRRKEYGEKVRNRSKNVHRPQIKRSKTETVKADVRSRRKSPSKSPIRSPSKSPSTASESTTSTTTSTTSQSRSSSSSTLSPSSSTSSSPIIRRKLLVTKATQTKQAIIHDRKRKQPFRKTGPRPTNQKHSTSTNKAKVTPTQSATDLYTSQNLYISQNTHDQIEEFIYRSTLATGSRDCDSDLISSWGSFESLTRTWIELVKMLRHSVLEDIQKLFLGGRRSRNDYRHRWYKAFSQLISELYDLAQSYTWRKDDNICFSHPEALELYRNHIINMDRIDILNTGKSVQTKY